MQRRDVPERKAANVAMFQRVVKINVATLKTNVATFQGSLNQRRDVSEKGKTDVAKLRRRDVATS